MGSLQETFKVLQPLGADSTVNHTVITGEGDAEDIGGPVPVGEMSSMRSTKMPV